MEQFNIAEALKYAPKGLKLYSPIFGEVKFKEIDDDDNYNCIVVDDKYNNRRWFYEYGTFFPSDESNYAEGECLLFPSVNHRCWNNWQNTLFLESIGSVCVDTILDDKFILDYNGTFFSDSTGHPYSALIEEDGDNYLLNSRYATPEETKEFFKELDENGDMWNGKMVVEKEDKQKFYVGDDVYKWDGKDLKKEQNKPKFKVGDVIKHKSTGEISTIKKVCSNFYILENANMLYFDSQDIWELIASKVKPTLEEKVNILADEIIALKQRVLALEIQVIKDMSTTPLTKDPYLYPDKVTCDDTLCHKGKCVSDVFKTPDKAGDNVTLEEMKS